MKIRLQRQSAEQISFTPSISTVCTIEAAISGKTASSPARWDPGWEMEPYIYEPDSWVEFAGIVWPGETSGTVGYFKFIYYGGQVSVGFTTVTSDEYEYSSFAWSADCEYVPLSTDTLTFGSP